MAIENLEQRLLAIEKLTTGQQLEALDEIAQELEEQLL
jgi:hypothetical protein